MKRDLMLYVEDILESIAKIEEYTSGCSEGDFEDDSQLKDAVNRRLEIIGEAVKNIPPAKLAEFPQTPWKKIAGTRDVLIHGYFGVTTGRVWEVVKDELPRLKHDVLMLKERLNADQKAKKNGEKRG